MSMQLIHVELPADIDPAYIADAETRLAEAVAIAEQCRTRSEAAA